MIGKAEHRIIFIVTRPANIPDIKYYSLMSLISTLVSQEGGHLLFLTLIQILFLFPLL